MSAEKAKAMTPKDVADRIESSVLRTQTLLTVLYSAAVGRQRIMRHGANVPGSAVEHYEEGIRFLVDSIDEEQEYLKRAAEQLKASGAV